MKRSLLLLSAIIVAAVASCTKESVLDSSIVDALSTKTAIEFTTYASDAATTKGVAINSNSSFQDEKINGSFEVKALVSDFNCVLLYENTDASSYSYSGYDFYPTAGDAVSYFDFTNVYYDSEETEWVNSSNMYWPNYSKVVHFAAYSPISTKISSSDCTFTQKTTTDTDFEDVDPDADDYTYECDYNYEYKFSFPYTVTDVIGDQVDLMYAMTSVEYLSPSDEITSNDTPYITDGKESTMGGSVNLHFKHALTQIAFTATKDAAIDVYVKSLSICNIYNSGTFTATMVTDDADTSDDSDNSTVGNSEESGDKVNADNFGTWSNTFDSAGWGDSGTDYTVDDSGEAFTFYYAVEGSGGHSSMSHYKADLDGFNYTSPYGVLTSATSANSIQIDDDSNAPTPITSSDEVLMLMPQKLTAWIPTASTGANCIGYYRNDSDGSSIDDIEEKYDDGAYTSSTKDSSVTYLAIDCEIYHKGATDYDAKIHDGYIFVPFGTENIDYAGADVDDPETTIIDEWLAGYKITYCLNFGGGYIVEEGQHTTLPEPGCIPDTKTYTLRPLTYTTSVDVWVDIEEDQDIEVGTTTN